MAYDAELAERTRELVYPRGDAEEKKMFGGLAFLLGGNMAVAVSGRGGLLVRVDRAESETLVDGAGVAPMTMGGRDMPGWLHVAPDLLDDDAVLQQWVERGVNFAMSLPRER
ncbi:TfoX/Sxy family protein [Nocardia halotolerans]|uniref:TfoX/Sxy family protein n=1 Tax=Nocardia halotolerans TaxID=1755878 RepID=A0ABV8VAI6_9NOCA